MAPNSKQTTPWLELLSCLVAARLTENIKKAVEEIIKIDDEMYWSDSTVALFWIKNVNKEYKQFVENRVQEIRKLAAPEHWNHCPTHENAADIASRGTTATQIVTDEKWWHGPSFLKKPPNEWPSPTFFKLPKEIDQELKTERKVKVTTTLAKAKTITESCIKIEESRTLCDEVHRNFEAS